MKYHLLVALIGAIILVPAAEGHASDCPQTSPLSETYTDTVDGFSFQFPSGWDQPRPMRVGGKTTLMVTRRGPVSGKVMSFARITASFRTKTVMDADTVERMTSGKKHKKNHDVVKMLTIKGKQIPLFKRIPKKPSSANGKFKQANAGPAFHFYYPAQDGFHSVSLQMHTEGAYDACMESLNALIVQVANSFK